MICGILSGTNKEGGMNRYTPIINLAQSIIVAFRTFLVRSISVICILILSSIRLLASPQQSELLIIQSDTIPLYQILLPSDLRNQLWNDHVSEMDFVDVMSTGNWRGYRGRWELADDELYLIGFEFGFGGLGLERLFPDRVKDGKVLADWYNSKLIIPKGNVLRWDGIFSRTYTEEEHLSFKNGHIKSRKIIQNYMDLPNGISRLVENPYFPNDEIAERIFNRIVSVQTNWNALDERCWQGVMGDYTFIIGANGRIKSIKDGFHGHSAVTRLFKRRLRGLRFDIIKFNGEPYEERVRFFIDLDENANELVLPVY